ncbi:hypothetical protein HEQ60_07065 [Haematospirillum sp. H1815]|uniref:hypothetical protein n=1 Tax=Haematospirillum sp. H1815 TaxID=2723108 RepID=UPI00143BCC8E|nr:hypothetical protein [Haematospirillum sp. H1815]NKD77519.1 hypothetical protein [Haematospirillum sp. H1815]
MRSGEQDPSRAFLDRLLGSIRHGHKLDDPRSPEVLQRWAIICRDLPDTALPLIIPATLRGLLRQADIGERLRDVCGISERYHLQHETIAPYLISYRRYMAARVKNKEPGSDEARLTIAKLRGELNALREEFNSVFDQAASAEMERERLAGEHDSLQQQLLAEQVRREEAERRLEGVRDQAFRQFRLYLFLLKEERDRLSNDPDRERLLAAEMAVETHALTLEALGAREDADIQAREILGETLFADYFQNPNRESVLPTTPNTSQAPDHDQVTPDNPDDTALNTEQEQTGS